MTLTIPEILENIKKDANGPDDFVRGLRMNNTAGMRAVILLAFSESPLYRNDLPPFTPDGSPEGLALSSMYAEIKRFYLFNKDYNLNTKRKDEILTQILESVNSMEVTLIRSLFEGTFAETYGINKDVASKAFPDLFAKAVSR